ncbi:MAG: heme d1 biosynthesis radical SAM protein NirJ [Burkholderiales bacterium]|nr:heme d1 biosynthesis radical SAM protein NirJ [Burkholderiales bacterium]
MLRITQYMKILRGERARVPAQAPPGPVVIWNLVRRCNLTCQHCYSISCDRDFPGELDTREALTVMEDLRRFGVPVLILSGGEPLLRPDIFELAAHARDMGFYVGLSSNGTLIDEPMARRIADTGFDYVGVSLDGREATHDVFRRKQGAYAAALAGIRRCREVGVKVGVRFTLTEMNAQELSWMLELLDAEAIDKFYLSHLNYAGRGNTNRRKDALLQTTRQAMDLVFASAWRDLQRGVAREYVTGNNDADAVYLLQWARAHAPARVEALREHLQRWGGNASGVGIANIDNVGNVHPDTYWWHYSLGNVRERPFSQIWSDTADPIMAGLKQRPRPVKGRCADCAHLAICGGNTRVRALQLTGDPWAEDPACYLNDDEIARPAALAAEA